MIDAQHDKSNFHLLLHAAQQVEDRVAVHLKPLGIRPRQARILDALERMGAVSQSTLAREFRITPASMSTMTARLVTAGYISRTRDPKELRSNILELTDLGRAAIADIKDAWRNVDQDIADSLGLEQSVQMARLAMKLRDALGGVPLWKQPQNND